MLSLLDTPKELSMVTRVNGELARQGRNERQQYIHSYHTWALTWPNHDIEWILRMYVSKKTKIATAAMARRALGFSPAKGHFARRGSVYVAASASAIKVGISGAPLNRVRQLNNRGIRIANQARGVNPEPVELLLVIPDCGAADERAIHDAFESESIANEWFRRGGLLDLRVGVLLGRAFDSVHTLAAQAAQDFARDINGVL